MKQELTNGELETYSRQIVLADIGYEGQLKLRNATACLIGLGGLGSSIAPQLVAMGIGSIRLVDRDIVSRSDLHRQFLYDVDWIGLPKAEAAWKKLGRLNPEVDIIPVPESLNEKNVEELISGVDVVLDGLDRPEPRYLVNRACVKLGIPYIFGAAIEAFGNVSTLIPSKTMCLECFMPDLKEDDLPKCGIVGVHPSVLGIVTAVQVSEAVRVIIGKTPKLLNKLLYIDLREMAFHSLDINSLDSCSVCGTAAVDPPTEVTLEPVEETCARDGRRNLIVSPNERVDLDLKAMKSALHIRGWRLRKSGTLGITFDPADGVTACLLKSGTMVVQISPKLEAYQKDWVLRLYRSILIEDLSMSESIIPL
jgi:molybdopterin/thiamine biosynthesis adenylyltransferase